MNRPSFNRYAENELLDAAAFYDAEARGLGNRFLGAVEQAVSEICEHPASGAPLPRSLRKKVLHDLPYNLIYHHRSDELRILAVAHHKRRPYYWLGRR